ncbi:FkbM family methyltransferase [Fictibacillus iocasae]|uniref:FkbM family methyltransferase n=1 Tax=Fictibacillus iocasae TaxID=2715437 RepID=A0ABW2NLM0_9BACL
MIGKTLVRKPYVTTMWEKNPMLWKWLIDCGILLKYKTLNVDKLPNKIVLESSLILYVDPDENRGRALLICNGVTQKRLNSFWSMAVEWVNPDVVIDVGVNYGECLFSVSYPAHAKIYGIEANHRLLPYIEQSRNTHPNQTQITIVNAFASEQNNVLKEFFVDKHWSGTSSASYMPSHNMIEKVSVPSITIDSLVREVPIHEKVLFKVDVEGYEAFVLKGMKKLLSSCDTALGFVEFNSEYITKAGISANEFLDDLQTHFTICFYNADDVLVKGHQLNLEGLQSVFGTSSVHTDLVLVKNQVLMDALEFQMTIQ